MGFLDYSFVPLSLPDLLTIMKNLIVFSSASSDQHLLLGTGAHRSLCSKHWLQSVNWYALQHIKLFPNTQPFRFVGHPLLALYGTQLVASIRDIYGKQHKLGIFAYVLLFTQISVLVLTNQRVSALIFASASITPVIFRYQNGTKSSYSRSHRTYS